MSFRSLATLLAFFFFFCLLVACGGSSGNGDIFIRGTLSTLPSFATSRSKETSPAQGIEVCCGGNCDATDVNGEFVISTDVADSLLCTASGGAFQNDSFVIDGLTGPGSYIVQVTAFRNADGSAAYNVNVDNDPPAVQPVCGNGIAEITGMEDCDGSDLGGEDCRSQGFSAGDLSCNSDCTFNKTQCFNTEQVECGDGIIEEPEQCEGSDLDGQTCETQGFLSGELACSPDCEFDTNNCTNVVDPPTCGNGQIEAGEDCEGTDLNGGTCESLGYTGGTLNCKSNCAYDESECIAPPPTCTESERICANTGAAPTCLACSCDDGFLIGNCNSTCADTGAAPTICSGGVGCSDGAEPVCPG